MARVRLLEIRNFRGISFLDWRPSSGLNCLIGPGDSGKSSILDALDLCLGARRGAQFSDADFNNLQTNSPIFVAATIGELPETVRSMEAYGQFLRGFDAATGTLEDEPALGFETVITVSLTVADDLEPVWSLVSDRAGAQGLVRNLNWAERVLIAPTRIGETNDLNLGWRRGSVLNRLSDQRADATAELVKASRDARAAFGYQAEEQMADTLVTVGRVADALGIPLKGRARALLDAGSLLLSGGTVSLHDQQGVPLDGLGTGSARLLVAGLQREAAPRASMVLVDELEHGLEPHRVIRLLGSLGAKEAVPPLQVFATTHSPVAVRELNCSQLQVVRQVGGRHQVIPASSGGDVQGTIRACPEAFLASGVMVCEGASEVGLIRGLDLYRTRNGLGQPLAARGIALVDAGGVTKLYARAESFMAFAYRTLTFRDDDRQPMAESEEKFIEDGGYLVKWRPGRALEDELFLSLPDEAVAALVEHAIELHGQAKVDAQIGSVTRGDMGLSNCAALLSDPGRVALASASKGKDTPWFKSVTAMEDVAAEIVGPHLAASDAGFREILEGLLDWVP